MANYNDNDLDELDFGQEGQTPETTPPEKKPSNRNFIIAISAIGAVFVLITIALVVVAVFVLPGQNKARQEASLQTQTANQSTAQVATAQVATEQAKKLIIVPPGNTPSPTATAAQPTITPVLASTNTPTKANPSSLATATTNPNAIITATATATAVADGQKATLSAQQTLLANGKFTATVIATSTALPNTGFADEFGLPALLGLGAAMIMVIFLVRRLRASVVH